MINITTEIKNIQDVEVNDVVLSFDEVEQITEWQLVEELHRPVVNKQDQVLVSFDNKGTIVTSTKHPMLCLDTNNEWKYKPTGDIVVGDICKTEYGKTSVVNIHIGYDEDPQFYDITVVKNNNFFAGDNYDSSVIIHNSATIYYPFWHSEVEDLLVLKNNKGTEETRVRHMDYGVQVNGYLLKRLKYGKNITLFNPHDVPDLYDAFFEDQELFAELYEKYERARSVQKQQVNSIELFNLVLLERNNTGRLYLQFVDHSNTHSSFNAATSPIRQSNLCVEITLPTAGLTRKSRMVYNEKTVEKVGRKSAEEFRKEYGEIALCTLSSINIGAIHSPEDFKKPAELAIRALDELLDYQDYPMISAGYPSQKRRSLGVGISNLAYFIAKHGNKYSDGSANNIVNEYIESMSYWLIKASNDLAKEKGACEWFDETKYSKGILPIDTYKKEVDEVLDTPSYLNWDSLRADVLKHGMRNSTVMAIMPVESSSQVINATNGIEPPRGGVSIKGSKDGTLKQVVPELHRFKNKYEYLWDMKTPRGYLEIAAIIQKWTDQSISTNTSYNPEHYPKGKITTSVLLSDIFYAYRLGCKTLYYQNTQDGSGEVYENKQTDDCEACKL